MHFCVRYEFVKGSYKDRQGCQKPYQNLKLYTATVNTEFLTWHPEVDPTSEYEQSLSCGGFRDRPRRWVKAADVNGKKGVNVEVFEAVTIPVAKLSELLGYADMDEFEDDFFQNVFLHGITVTGIPNDYGRLEIQAVQISKENVLELISQRE